LIEPWTEKGMGMKDMVFSQKTKWVIFADNILTLMLWVLYTSLILENNLGYK